MISPSTSSATYNNTKIGTAVAFGTVFDSINTGTTNTYKLFLTDINLNATASISGARSFIIKTGSGPILGHSMLSTAQNHMIVQQF